MELLMQIYVFFRLQVVQYTQFIYLCPATATHNVKLGKICIETYGNVDNLVFISLSHLLVWRRNKMAENGYTVDVNATLTL